MRRLQKSWVNRLPEKMRERTRQSIRRQNAFALRYGLIFLVVVMNFVLAMVAVTLAFRLALSLYDSGALSIPQK